MYIYISVKAQSGKDQSGKVTARAGSGAFHL